jgi:gas vesicle structural protein
MPSDFESITLTGQAEQDVSLLDIIDHVLNAGVVIHGSLVISVAGVDLVYLGLNVVLTSVETALRNIEATEAKKLRGGA